MSSEWKGSQPNRAGVWVVAVDSENRGPSRRQSQHVSRMAGGMRSAMNAHPYMIVFDSWLDLVDCGERELSISRNLTGSNRMTDTNYWRRRICQRDFQWPLI